MKTFRPLISANFATLRSAAFLVLLAGGWLLSTSEAAVRELWHVYSPNTSEAHSFSVAASAVDTNGNLVVAGAYSTGPYRNLFVSSYDAGGAKLWEYTDGPAFDFFVDGLIISPNGEVILSVAENTASLDIAASLICFKAGEIKWARTELNIQINDGFRKMKMNQHGEIFVFAFDANGLPPDSSFPSAISRIDPLGRELWRTRLPFISQGTAYSLSPFDLSATGQPIIASVAGSHLPSVVACLDTQTGRTRWKRHPRGIVQSYAAVKAGSRSICVSGDGGFVVFANNGRRLAVRRDYRYFSENITMTREGGFMLLSANRKSYHAVLSPSGRVRWNNFSEPFPAIGFFEDTVDGYVLFGHLDSSLVFRRVDKRGQPVSSELLADYPGASWQQRGTTVLAAPDGTWRVVVNRGTYDFIIAAYGEVPDGGAANYFLAQ